MAPTPQRQRLRIGEWVADPATNQLRRGDEVVKVEPRSMDLLMLLARRAGEVVGREELLSTVWPGVVVGDEALTQGITKLRRALGDDPRVPTYIETISKRGYRMLAAVSPMQARDAKWTWSFFGVSLVAVLAAAAYLLFAAHETPQPGTPSVAEAPSEPWVSVTVQPFEAPSGDPAQAYFARGISDSLMTELGRISSLRVITSPSATPAHASRLAQYLVTGSVQRDPPSLRIQVRLVHTATGEQLWSERYERPAADLFAVEAEIIGKLSQALPARVSESERQRLARRHTRSLEAYDRFLRAQALFLVRGARENEEARSLYREALEIDPKFARAYAGLAMTHAMDHRLQFNVDPAGLERALELAETARLIDPDIAEVHWAIGFVHAQARRHDQAIEALQRAIELNPSFADAYALMGGIHTYAGEPAKSIPLLRTAMRFHPDGGYLYFLLLGRAYFFGNDLEQALINLREAVVRNPADVESHIYLAATLAASGQRRAAEWEMQEVRSLERGFVLARWLESYPLSSRPHKERLLALLAGD